MRITSQGDWWFVAGLIAPRLPAYTAEFPGVSWDAPAFDSAMAAGDHDKCWRMMQKLWEDLPDDPSIRHAPFFDLADLCSEVWVFHPEVSD